MTVAFENVQPKGDIEIQKEEDAGVHETLAPLDPQLVKSMKRKADFILLPLLALAYLFNSLDRSNLSNAHTAGLGEDLHLKGNEFNKIMTFYQVPFIVLGPVLTMLTKTVGARWTIPGMLLCFGAASLGGGFMKDYGGLVACRVFVGVFESGFLASVVFYLSLWYTRQELASRIGIFYAALTASSAFGGLLAFGMFQVEPQNGYFKWSYLFFLDGALTMSWGILLFFILPSGSQTAWFLNESEKEVALQRLERDSVSGLETKFSWKESFGEFMVPHGYIRCFNTFVAGVILTSNANFLAMVVTRLGYDTIKTNLYTVAPALTGAVCLVAFCKSSDYFKERGIHEAASAVVSLVGYILLITVDTHNTAVLYFAMFLCTIGAYPSTPIDAAWTVANIPNLNSRAMLSGIYVSISNCSGFVSSNIYFEWEAPRYITSLQVNIAMCCVLIASVLSYSFWMRWENRRRDRVQGITPGSEGYSTVGVTSTKDPRFRFQP